MPFDTFPAYRLVSVFIVTLAVADGLYRCQAIIKLQEKLFKPTPIDKISNGVYFKQ